MSEPTFETDDVYAVVMAGGRGTRFWPKSRRDLAKQFLDLTGGGTMIRLTWDRIRPILSPDHVLVVAGRDQGDLVRGELPELPVENLILEPSGRNTAPCIALAARVLEARGGAVMAVLPADHLIARPGDFRRCLVSAVEVARGGDALITFGMRPTHPHTGYGYIEKGPPVGAREDLFEVARFAEKPDLETAGKMLESGRFLWNSGMFVWRTDVILEETAAHLPAVADGVERIGRALGTDRFPAVLAEEYPHLETISIDYGVMERSDRVLVIEADFGWNDVGSWSSLEELLPADESGNVSPGDLVSLDARNNIVHAPRTLVALLGVEDLVVIGEKDCILVARKDRAQDVREITRLLEERGREDLA